MVGMLLSVLDLLFEEPLTASTADTTVVMLGLSYVTMCTSFRAATVAWLSTQVFYGHREGISDPVTMSSMQEEACKEPGRTPKRICGFTPAQDMFTHPLRTPSRYAAARRRQRRSFRCSARLKPH